MIFSLTGGFMVDRKALKANLLTWALLKADPLAFDLRRRCLMLICAEPASGGDGGGSGGGGGTPVRLSVGVAAELGF